jgi:hypothetical protein
MGRGKIGPMNAHSASSTGKERLIIYALLSDLLTIAGPRPRIVKRAFEGAK